MKNELLDSVVRHSRIHNPDSSRWDLTPIIYLARANVAGNLSGKTTEQTYQANLVKSLKEHAEALLDIGRSLSTVANAIRDLKAMFRYLHETGIQYDDLESIRRALYQYSEHQFTRANLKEIKHRTAYFTTLNISLFLNGLFEDLQFDISQTRLRPEKISKRVLSREAEKVMLKDARQLANFCFEITKNFDPSTLRSGTVPILVEVADQEINLTPHSTKSTQLGSDFTQTSAYMAFNQRVSAEVFIFLGMTIQNQSPIYNLKRLAFAYKPIGATYEIREYKNRRGGEVLFKIPKPYKPYFEKYLSFLDEYAPESEWLFPYLKKGMGFRQRTEDEVNKFRRLCSRYEIAWVKPSAFRKIGENILMWLASDEHTASEYANHAVSTFRQSYEFPSLQRSMIEIGRFWDRNDPLTHGKPKVSLFNTPCNGVPQPVNDATNDLAEPDCITPTGCIGCLHYRDEESFDYVWGLHSFRFLKVIESSSYHTRELKQSNIAIDWVNLKIEWFKNSDKPKHQDWVEEASLRIEEGDYHPSWSRRIEKFET